jgi:NADH-quinone oxidoreductase subunit C
MEEKAIQKLKGEFPEAVLEVREFREERTIVVPKGRIVEICRYLKADSELRYNFLSDLTSVDFYETEQPRFEVIYHLLSHPNKKRLRLKIRVEEGEKVPSVTGVWSTANWHEREVYDLMGIEFENHPDLRRILTPDDWVGHPLRKDYPLTYEQPVFTHTKRRPPDLIK